MGSTPINRVVYRFWHQESDAGKVGYIGKDKYWPKRSNLKLRSKKVEHPKLYSALQKYPWPIWHIEVLQSNIETDKALKLAEICWIAKFDARRLGYNCTDGGDGSSGWVPSEESREKMRRHLKGNQHAKGNKFSLELRQLMGKRQLGRRHSKETLDKMRRAALKRWKEHPWSVVELIKGNKNPSKERRKHMSESQKKRWAKNGTV